MVYLKQPSSLGLQSSIIKKLNTLLSDAVLKTISNVSNKSYMEGMRHALMLAKQRHRDEIKMRRQANPHHPSPKELEAALQEMRQI